MSCIPEEGVHQEASVTQEDVPPRTTAQTDDAPVETVLIASAEANPELEAQQTEDIPAATPEHIQKPVSETAATAATEALVPEVTLSETHEAPAPTPEVISPTEDNVPNTALAYN
jgi:hypothetical protein